MKHVIEFIKNNKRVWFFTYIIPYLIWFAWLESRTDLDRMHVVECPLDRLIPFCEYFIIPYMLWFVYICATWLYLCITSRREFYQFIIFIYSGMTLFLIISTIYPNGLNLRVSYDADKNIFTMLTAFIQSADTPTNVFPSIHVFNSIGACIALWKNQGVKKHPVIKYLILILTVSICLSTVFLRQHSVIDVIGGIAMSGFFYWFCYSYLEKKEFASSCILVSE